MVVVVVVVRGGKHAFGAHTPSAPSMPNIKGKRLGQHACIGRVAQGQRGGGMLYDTCVCWACLKIGRESLLGLFVRANRRFRRHTHTHTHMDRDGGL